MPDSPAPNPGEVTRLLALAGRGDPEALDRLFPLVYAELRLAADRLLRRERPGHTLQPTALVHEAYLKLVGPGSLPSTNRAHFLGIAARAMRQILVDHARRRRAEKRGGGVAPEALTEHAVGSDLQGLDDLVALDEAMRRLAEVGERMHQVVELRYFAGLTEEEVAQTLGVTVRTVQRDWAKARAWLYTEMYPRDD